MEQLSNLKELQLQDHFKNLKRKKKSNKKKITFVQTLIKKRGLIAKIRELVVFKVLDKVLSYDYKYEHSYFQEAEDFKTVKGYIKYISKTVDTKFDFVSNDIEANYFNGFKTFVTFNTKVYKFIKSYEKMRPLKKINLYTKRIEGLYPKQKEFYNLTGGNRNYHTLEVLTDVTDKTSTFSNIFAYFTLLRKHIICLLSQINDLSFNTLFKTIFITKLAYFKHKIVIFLNGFKAIFRRSKFRFKIRRKFEAKKPFKFFRNNIKNKYSRKKLKNKYSRNNYFKAKKFFFIKKMKLRFHKDLILNSIKKSYKVLNKKINVKSNRYLLTRRQPHKYKVFWKKYSRKCNKRSAKRLRITKIKFFAKNKKKKNKNLFSRKEKIKKLLSLTGQQYYTFIYTKENNKNEKTKQTHEKY